MTDEQRKRFEVISNPNKEKKKEYTKSYQTDPLREKLVKFTEKEKFTVADLLKW